MGPDGYCLMGALRFTEALAQQNAHGLRSKSCSQVDADQPEVSPSAVTVTLCRTFRGRSCSSLGL